MPPPADGLDPSLEPLIAVSADLLDAREQLDAQAVTIDTLATIARTQAVQIKGLIELTTMLLGRARGA